MLSQNIFVAAALAITSSQASLVNIRAVAAGSDAYNCHDNCGNAILEVQAASADICSDNIFLTDYANCLLCAGEDKDNIWKYYGSQLTSAAAGCGLSTTPYAGSTTSTIQSALVAQTAPAASASTTADASVSPTAAATTSTETAGSVGTTSVVSSTASANATATSVVTAGASTIFEKSMLVTAVFFGAVVTLMTL
ncbi:hypothetical protein TruAng_002762 [Truncatella angustata]|nr:hypothetical protein TruAng_002762 [Truncatella angustata]